ncbi:serine hydrolase [Pedobacter heparinus]|uniref:serine hydrolase n=1 Tax=Pedobacter heparinus TaxID=984 RepID=UPI00292DB470|nr:serine hydrolase [Pedobacter heparinus]
MISNKLSTYFYSIFLSFFISNVSAQQPALPPDLDDYVAEVLQAFQVPGIGLGIVKDGKIVLAKGYGVRKLGDPAPVDENTLFSIASNSKAFTATAIAMLVEEGKLKWEDKVIEHLPWFRMADDYVTTHLTLRDLFVHHSGLNAYANDVLLFPPSKFSRRELLEKLKDVKLKYDFRTVYAYDNILYLAAGEVIAAKTGMSWEDFVKTRIFNKIGMSRSISKYSGLKGQANIAYAHAIRDGKLQMLDSFFDMNIGDASNPAGGVVSTAKDMSKWLITQLDSGRMPDQGRLFKPAATQELWKIIRPMPVGQEPEWLKPAQRHFSGYALGFRTYDYRQYQVIGHGGLLTGFVSQIAMVPDLKLGVVVLTNQLSTGAYNAIINHILDYNMKAAPFDWLAGFKKDWDRSLVRRDSVLQTRKKILPDASLQLSLPLEKYSGVYKDGLMGNIVISKADQGLSMRFVKSPLYEADLVHFHGDMFKVNYKNSHMGEGPFLSFSLNPDLSIREGRFISSFSNADAELEDIILTPDKKSIMDTAELGKRIRLETGKYKNADFAVAFKDMGTGETFLVNAKTDFHAASTMKTPVMAEVFKQAAKGKFAISDSIKVYNRFKSIADGSLYKLKPENDSEQELYAMVGKKITIENMLLRMITKSSNLATNILIDKVGAKNTNKTMRSIGANDIQVLRGVEDGKAFEKGMNNTVTAYDLMLLFEKMAKGEMVNKKASEAMVGILMQQTFRGIIPARLPKEVSVANKTGSITKVLNDSGIVYLPDGRKYVLVLLSRGMEEEAAKKTLSTISEYIYNYETSK